MRDQFLEGMSKAASSVTVVTTDGAAGRAGVTVSAMCSVSADPPALLICVHHMSAAAEVIERNGVFCVNLLSERQSAVSDTFAGRMTTADGDRFACADWVPNASGTPRLEGALAAFDCHVADVRRFGSHVIFTAEVVAIAQEDGLPLIYGQRSYGAPALWSGAAPAAHTVAGA